MWGCKKNRLKPDRKQLWWNFSKLITTLWLVVLLSILNVIVYSVMTAWKLILRAFLKKKNSWWKSLVGKWYSNAKQEYPWLYVNETNVYIRCTLCIKINAKLNLKKSEIPAFVQQHQDGLTEDRGEGRTTAGLDKKH